MVKIRCIYTTKEGNCKAWDLQPCIFNEPRIVQEIRVCRIAKTLLVPRAWEEGPGEVKKIDPDVECPW